MKNERICHVDDIMWNRHPDVFNRPKVVSEPGRIIHDELYVVGDRIIKIKNKEGLEDYEK